MPPTGGGGASGSRASPPAPRSSPMAGGPRDEHAAADAERLQLLILDQEAHGQRLHAEIGGGLIDRQAILWWGRHRRESPLARPSGGACFPSVGWKTLFNGAAAGPTGVRRADLGRT